MPLPSFPPSFIFIIIIIICESIPNLARKIKIHKVTQWLIKIIPISILAIILHIFSPFYIFPHIFLDFLPQLYAQDRLFFLLGLKNHFSTKAFHKGRSQNVKSMENCLDNCQNWLNAIMGGKFDLYLQYQESIPLPWFTFPPIQILIGITNILLSISCIIIYFLYYFLTIIATPLRICWYEYHKNQFLQNEKERIKAAGEFVCVQLMQSFRGIVLIITSILPITLFYKWLPTVMGLYIEKKYKTILNPNENSKTNAYFVNNTVLIAQVNTKFYKLAMGNNELKNNNSNSTKKMGALEDIPDEVFKEHILPFLRGEIPDQESREKLIKKSWTKLLQLIKENKIVLTPKKQTIKNYIVVFIYRRFYAERDPKKKKKHNNDQKNGSVSHSN